MQEVFEKIDAILQKYRKKWLEQPNTEPCKGLECISNDCVDCMLTHLENDINQVAEEYDNDFCEWKSDFNWFSGKCKHETSCGYTFYDLKHAEPFKVCPYCGKKIKVVE